MPTSYILDEGLCLLYFAGVGRTMGHQFAETLRVATEAIEGLDKVDLLLDLREATELDLDAGVAVDEIIRHGQAMHKKLQGGRVAGVTGKREDETLFYLFGSLFEKDETTKVKTFPVLSKALAWLGHAGAEGRIEKLRQKLFTSSGPGILGR